MMRHFEKVLFHFVNPVQKSVTSETNDNGIDWRIPMECCLVFHFFATKNFPKGYFAVNAMFGITYPRCIELYQVIFYDYETPTRRILLGKKASTSRQNMSSLAQ